MEHLNITIGTPEGDFVPITITAKDARHGHFSHTEKFHHTVPLGQAMTIAGTNFVTELKAWTRFVKALMS